MPKKNSRPEAQSGLRIAGDNTPQPEPAQKVTVRLPARLARLLKAYCAFHGTTAKKVATAALESHLAGFYCATQPPRTGRGQPATQQPTEEEAAAG